MMSSNNNNDNNANLHFTDHDEDLHMDVIDTTSANHEHPTAAASSFPDHTLSTLGDTSRRPWYRRRSLQLSLAATLLLLVIIAIAVPASRNKKLQAQVNAANALGVNGTGTSKPFVFVPELPESEIVNNKQAFSAVLLQYYQQYNLNWNVLTDSTTPQAKSLEWVAGSVTYLELDPGRRVQRYALGVFYYSTYSVANSNYFAGQPASTVPGWTSAANWMSAADECTWEGIECQDGTAVSSLLLRQHQLSGTLPLEMAFLESLTDLDLTSNFVYVDGEASVTPFTTMTQLQSLEMEDNYVVTINSGVPPSIANMTSLQKLVMSYNILQGPLDGALFGKLSQLTHLEIESNFITGDFPSTIVQNANLLYIYMRRNLMTIHLPTLLGADTLSSIFAVWLDTNIIQGGIPTTIGNHTALASISFTNASLTGNIPSELGELTGLRRVWLYTNQLQGPIPQTLAQNTELEVLELYQNQLTGTMPPGVCQTIANSNYEFKVLSADCNSVSCQNCCTQCMR